MISHSTPSESYPDRVARHVIAQTTRLSYYERGIYLEDIIRCDMHLASDREMLMHMQSRVMADDSIYRVSVFPDGVDVVCLGLESVDSCLEGHYDQIDDLPNWVKERLAILNMIPPTTPTQEVEGVGRRISGHVYWVFAPVSTVRPRPLDECERRVTRHGERDE